VVTSKPLGVGSPPAGTRRASMDSTSTWLPEAAADLAQQLGPGQRGGVHADLVGAGPQQPVHVVGGPHAAADGQRDEDLLGGAPHHVVRRLPAAAAGGDVEEHQLVGALGVVHPGHLDRVAGVAQGLEVDALDDAARRRRPGTG
jgi:hypothetical protein